MQYEAFAMDTNNLPISTRNGQIWPTCYKFRKLLELMVARDGIEPPTPAFSGPRSTTELPGLSADFQLHFLRLIRLCRRKVGGSTNSLLQRLG